MWALDKRLVFVLSPNVDESVALVEAAGVALPVTEANPAELVLAFSLFAGHVVATFRRKYLLLIFQLLDDYAQTLHSLSSLTSPWSAARFKPEVHPISKLTKCPEEDQL